MNRSFLLIVTLLVALTLVSCASTGMNPSETSTAPSIESTAPSATEPPADPYRGVYQGMTYEEFLWTIPQIDWSNYLYYYYFANANGDYVVFLLDDNHSNPKIKDVRICNKPEEAVTSKTFQRLQEGMSFYEVISIVGLPEQITGSGIIRMNYYTDDGLHYYLSFSYTDMTLTGVGSIEYTVPTRLGDEKHCGLSVGMVGGEHRYIVHETQFFSFGYGIEKNDFAFMRNVDGNHVIARTNDGVFTRIECYDADSLDLSPESFESIPMGVDLFTVASKVGIPHHAIQSSNNTRDLCYLASDGTKYVVEVRRVYETQGDDITDLYVVKDVRLYEEN